MPHAWLSAGELVAMNSVETEVIPMLPIAIVDLSKETPSVPFVDIGVIPACADEIVNPNPIIFVMVR